MAKIKKVGQALVLTSAITTKDYDKVSKFKPTALELRTEKGEVTFKVALGSDASISKYGINFDSADKDCNLQLTAMTYATEKEEIIEDYAVVLASLKKVEDQVAAARNEVNELFESVSGSVEVE